MLFGFFLFFSPDQHSHQRHCLFISVSRKSPHCGDLGIFSSVPAPKFNQQALFQLLLSSIPPFSPAKFTP
jgi:hypothetical protein